MDSNSLIDFRRKLHSYPELSGQESTTAATVASFFRRLDGWHLSEKIGGFGLLATLDTGKSGSHTVFRAELDALPIQERTGVSHASKNDGIGHHCGHDGHATILCGLAHVLIKKKPSSGKITLLFQPAEEIGEGAQAMLDDLDKTGFKPDRIIALHNIPGEQLGAILIRSGLMLVASCGAEIHFEGESSHAAEPENGKSSWMAMRALTDEALAWSSTVVPLKEQAKVTLVGCNIGGARYGTSPGDGTVWLTMRSYHTPTLQKLKDILEVRAKALAAMYSLTVNITFIDEFDATVNDEVLVAELREVAATADCEVIDLAEPYSYSEDFGRFSSVAPTLFFGLGAGENHPPLHASKYDFPDELLQKGINIFKLLVDKYHQ